LVGNAPETYHKAVPEATRWRPQAYRRPGI